MYCISKTIGFSIHQYVRKLTYTKVTQKQISLESSNPLQAAEKLSGINPVPGPKAVGVP